MKQMKIESHFNKTQTYIRRMGRQAILYANIYEALKNDKKVLYITYNSLDYIRKSFKDLFGVKLKCIRQSENSVKLILIKNEENE